MTYPAGQADADVTTHVAARIVASIPKILIVRMASLLIVAKSERHQLPTNAYRAPILNLTM